MKRITLIILTLGLVTIYSCADKPKPEGISAQVVEEILMPKTIVGKVYGLSESIDTSSCESTPPGTDYFPTLIFLDDSLFVKIINTCCGDVGEDFAGAWYYTGKYNLDDKNLRLTYKTKMAVFYSLEIENPKNDSSQSKTHIEIEKSDFSVENLERFDCKNRIYFKHISGDWKDELMAQNSESATDEIKEMKDIGVWDKLYGKN